MDGLGEGRRRCDWLAERATRAKTEARRFGAVAQRSAGLGSLRLDPPPRRVCTETTRTAARTRCSGLPLPAPLPPRGSPSPPATPRRPHPRPRPHPSRSVTSVLPRSPRARRLRTRPELTCILPRRFLSPSPAPPARAPARSRRPVVLSAHPRIPSRVRNPPARPPPHPALPTCTTGTVKPT